MLGRNRPAEGGGSAISRLSQPDAGHPGAQLPRRPTALPELLTIGWSRAWHFTPVTRLQRNTLARRAAARAWTWQWGIVAVLAVWMLPFHLLAVARQSDEIWLIPGASARVCPTQQQAAARRPLCAAVVSAAVFVVAAALALGPMAAVVEWAGDLGPAVVLRWLSIAGTMWWLGALLLTVIVICSTPRAARHRALMDRASQLAGPHRQGYAVSEVVAGKGGTGAGTSLMLALQKAWVQAGDPAVLHAATPDLAGAFYARLGWQPDGDDRGLRMIWERADDAPLRSNRCSIVFLGMDRYINEMDAPRKQPLRPAGVNYPVIIRLVLDDASEEWRPGQAIKWTDTGVLVRWEGTPGDPRSATHAWLPIGDVKRVIRRPTTDGAPPQPR